MSEFYCGQSLWVISGEGLKGVLIVLRSCSQPTADDCSMMAQFWQVNKKLQISGKKQRCRLLGSIYRTTACPAPPWFPQFRHPFTTCRGSRLLSKDGSSHLFAGLPQHLCKFGTLAIRVWRLDFAKGNKVHTAIAVFRWPDFRASSSK